jgi:hypothetical protein
MNCRSCNTPIPSRSSSCPNCGRSTGAGESFIDEPGESGSASIAEESQRLGPATALGGEEDDELSLEDAVVPAAPASIPKPSAPVASGVRPGQTTSAARSVPTKTQEPRPLVSRPETKRPAKGAATLPDPDTVRAILAEHPELLEPGLEILTDDGGQEIGVQHATDVGVIDLLAHDAQGRLVAVIVAGPASGRDLVGEALHRLGWVRKHLAKNGEDVRGIVVTDHVDVQLGYAAAAVSDKIKFKSYTLTLALTDLEF